MNKIKLVFLFLIFIKCSLTNQTNSNSVHILFIGNSLTYTNNLPQLVKNSAKQKGVIINTTMIAYPNYAIHDHWNEGKVQKEISNNHYDYVIIQQGPSSQSLGRKILIEYGDKYSNLCKKNNAKLCYYMVWPARMHYHTFEGVIKNYRDASIINDAYLCPVGEKWKNHFDLTSNFDYYSSDQFHPSMKGSEVAATVIVEKLFL